MTVSKELLFSQFSRKLNSLGEGKAVKNQLSKAFEDIDKVLSFESMSDVNRNKIWQEMANIGIQISIPPKKQRDKFFGAIEKTLKSLEELKAIQFDWGSLIPVQDQILALESQLSELVNLRKTWKNGRRNELNRYQVQGINYLYEKLKLSQQDKLTKPRWKNFNVSQIGQFTSQNISAVQKYRATPSRLIANFSNALGVNIAETTIESEIKKNLKRKKSS